MTDKLLDELDALHETWNREATIDDQANPLFDPAEFLAAAQQIAAAYPALRARIAAAEGDLVEIGRRMDENNVKLDEIATMVDALVAQLALADGLKTAASNFVWQIERSMPNSSWNKSDRLALDALKNRLEEMETK